MEVQFFLRQITILHTCICVISTINAKKKRGKLFFIAGPSSPAKNGSVSRTPLATKSVLKMLISGGVKISFKVNEWVQGNKFSCRSAKKGRIC